MDWASRRVLAWRLSNTMDTEFCLAALAEALEGYGTPEIFNTDQGSQFTSIAFTGQLEATGIRCSMDGRGANKRTLAANLGMSPGAVDDAVGKLESEGVVSASRMPGTDDVTVRLYCRRRKQGST